MPATALYTVAMSPADAFVYTREALQAAGASLGTQSPPSQIEFSLLRRGPETGSIDIVMPGRAVIAPAGDGHATVTVAIEPATQFIVYAVGLGIAAYLFGWLFLGSLNTLWFLLILGGEAYVFWSLFNQWPADALAAIHAKMQASPSVSGGTPVVAPAAPIFTPPSPAAPSPTANAADIAEQIRHLAELRDQGHLTQEEFDAKKAELLKRI